MRSASRRPLRPLCRAATLRQRDSTSADSSAVENWARSVCPPAHAREAILHTAVEGLVDLSMLYLCCSVGCASNATAGARARARLSEFGLVGPRLSPWPLLHRPCCISAPGVSLRRPLKPASLAPTDVNTPGCQAHLLPPAAAVPCATRRQLLGNPASFAAAPAAVLQSSSPNSAAANDSCDCWLRAAIKWTEASLAWSVQRLKYRLQLSVRERLLRCLATVLELLAPAPVNQSSNQSPPIKQCEDAALPPLAHCLLLPKAALALGMRGTNR